MFVLKEVSELINQNRISITGLYPGNDVFALIDNGYQK